MKRVYLLPNIITTFGLACGLFVIFRMVLLPAGDVTFRVVLTSALLLVVAAVADLLDGMIARMVKAETSFGELFDSLSDAITFGVAPAVLMLKSLNISGETKLTLLASTAAMLYAICGVLRLVRYNTQPAPLERRYRIFTGLPITAAAAVSIATSLFLLSQELREAWYISHGSRAIAMTCVMGLLAYLMVSRWKFPGLQVLQMGTSSFHLIFFTMLFVVLLFYGMVYYFSFVFFAIVWLYVLVAWGLSVLRLLLGTRAKLLDDFAPEPENSDS